MKTKAIFLDRDGVINKTIKRFRSSYNQEVDDSPSNVLELQFVDGIRDFVDFMRKLNYKIIVVTNQPNILLNDSSLNDYESITTKMCDFLGLKREDVFECLHKEDLCMECGCRKPKPGLFFMANGVHNIDFSSSIMVGDSWKDVYASKEAGVGTTIFLTRNSSEKSLGNIKDLEKMRKENKFPDYVVNSLNDINVLITPQINIDKLELGSGGKPTPGYLHQDITQLPGIKLDFTCNPWEIPLDENTLSEVIALGLMEHLRFEEFDKTLEHIYKLLKKGSAFLFDVPDMKVWSEYLYNLTHGMQDKNIFRPKHIWSTFYGWQRWIGDEHKCGWTRDELISKVKEIGYSNIEEGVQIFTSKGIERGRFTRGGDAHIYIKAIK